MLFPDDIGDYGTARRLKKRPHYGFEKQERVNKPDGSGGAHQDHAEYDYHAGQVGGDHNVLAAQAVVDNAGGGAGESRGQDLEHQSQADGLGFSR